jgi:hypothetical protein
MRRRLLLFALSFAISIAASLAATYIAVLRPMRRSWGLDPDEGMSPLPGDDLVPDAPLVETRGISIDAPPAAVWPWLVQMGYGRGGWYSYDKMDNDAASADRILPEFQTLSVGDVMPTWPGGGFQVAALDPGRSLVLYLDTPMVKAQQAAHEQTLPEPITPGIRAAGAMGDTAMPEFKATWAFVLQPLDGDKTRVIERLRAWAPEPSGIQKLALPILGMGVFLMTRKQLLGLKERIERFRAFGGIMPAATVDMVPPADPVPDPEETTTA